MDGFRIEFVTAEKATAPLGAEDFDLIVDGVLGVFGETGFIG
jgi:hypothetical protein